MATKEEKAAAKKAAEEAAALEQQKVVAAKALELSGLDQTAFDALSDEEKAKHVEAAVQKLEAEAEEAKKPKLVKMVRDAELYPSPHTADVHPEEVENYKAGGWEKAE